MAAGGEAVTPVTERGGRWFRTLVEHGTDAIILFGATGAVLYATPAVKQVVGYSAEELAGRVSLDLIHPDDVPTIRTQQRRMRETPGEAVTAEYRIKLPDGSWRWMEALGKNLLDEPGVAAIVASFRDIDDRKRMEEELRASRDQLEAIFRSVADGLVVQNARGRLVYANETAAHMLGFDSAEALLQAPPHDVMRHFEILGEGGDAFPAELLPGRRVIRGESVPELTLRFRTRATGAERWIAITST
ncbi:MAG: PAS domain S-box protein, partial [Dehalococcoidia bacterium]